MSSTLMGSFLAAEAEAFSWTTGILAFLTTILLQILSNLANDLGDSQHGVDDENRTGPQRAVQSGRISRRAMQRGVLLFAILSLISGLALLFNAFGGLSLTWPIFFVLGLAAIGSALKYTMGSSPYGYRGFGDLFVLVFFGWVGVAGTYFLHAGVLSADILLPATAVGLFAVGVLNMNNMRDVVNDGEKGKRTMVVWMGFERAKIYHTALLLMGIALAVVYGWLRFEGAQFLYVLAFIPLLINIRRVWNTDVPSQLNSELKKIALSSLAYTLLTGIVIGYL